eukprot:TRINITY_DN10473_c0_g2_i10.p1 TRINITY_DN10473_c0_g2~~TRINITY_DN10473_c0_g2_i10.p1  ORF type:complete len:112 (-),score=11.93 TRINITY_DN10473_c0_g2_i10:302-637(-)
MGVCGSGDTQGGPCAPCLSASERDDGIEIWNKYIAKGKSDVSKKAFMKLSWPDEDTRESLNEHFDGYPTVTQEQWLAWLTQRRGGPENNEGLFKCLIESITNGLRDGTTYG